MKTHCKRGHKFTEKTTRFAKLQSGKYTVRVCRMCASLRDKAKWEALSDEKKETWRARARACYHRRKAENVGHQDIT
jgi:hypothetical protein